MELLRPVVNIHKKKIVKKQVFNKVILIKPLFICHQQILDLECRKLSYHVHIIAAALCKQDVLKLVLVKYLEELIARNYLAVGRRIHKRKNRTFILFRIFKCGSQHFSFNITDTKVNPRDFLQSVDVRLEDLI